MPETERGNPALEDVGQLYRCMQTLGPHRLEPWPPRQLNIFHGQVIYSLLGFFTYKLGVIILLDRVALGITCAVILE